MRRTLIALACSALAAPALAADGVREVNQTCAVQTGCFSGDTAGLPVTIDGSAGDSYRLTSDLVVPDADTDGFFVSAPNLTIDLNGFAILRAGCEGATTSCAVGTGDGSGVDRPANSALPGLAVHDGAVIGMGQWGLNLGDGARVTEMRLRWNRLDGLVTGRGALVSGNNTQENGRYGVLTGAGSTISTNAVIGNGVYGIFTGEGSVVSDNSVFENTTAGILAGDGSTVRGNSVRGNGAGISIGAGGVYQANAISNNGSTVVGGGVDGGGNACNGSATCP